MLISYLLINRIYPWVICKYILFLAIKSDNNANGSVFFYHWYYGWIWTGTYKSLMIWSEQTIYIFIYLKTLFKHSKALYFKTILELWVVRNIYFDQWNSWRIHFLLPLYRKWNGKLGRNRDSEQGRTIAFSQRGANYNFLREAPLFLPPCKIVAPPPVSKESYNRGGQTCVAFIHHDLVTALFWHCIFSKTVSPNNMRELSDLYLSISTSRLHLARLNVKRCHANLPRQGGLVKYRRWISNVYWDSLFRIERNSF